MMVRASMNKTKARSKKINIVFVIFFLSGLLLFIALYNINPLKTSTCDLHYITNLDILELSGNGEKILRNGVTIFTKGSSLWVSDKNGTNQTKVVEIDNGNFGGMAISNNGEKIAYTIDYFDDNWIFDRSELWVIDANGENHENLFVLNEGAHHKIIDMAFSLDEHEIIFVVCYNWGRPSGTLGSSLNIVNIDSKVVTELLSFNASHIGSSEYIYTAEFSHDESQICLSRTSGIYVMDLDGSNIKLVADAPIERTIFWSFYDAPSFSNSGEKLVFISERHFASAGPEYDVFLINYDGSSKTRIFSGDGESIGSLQFSTETDEIMFIKGSTIYKMEYDEGRLLAFYLFKIFSIIMVIVGASGLVIFWYKKRKSSKSPLSNNDEREKA